MPKAKLYFIFIAVFLVMHFTGVMASGLPYILNALITSTIVFTTLLLLLSRESNNSLMDQIRSIGFQKTNSAGMMPGFIITVLLLLSYPLLGLIINTKVFLARDWHLNLAGLILTGGLAEEVLFRGYFFGRLRRAMSFPQAALTSALFFTLAHLMLFTYMDWPVAMLSTLLAVAISVPFAFLYEFGNTTIWSPAIVHTTIRTVGLVITTDENHFTQFSMLWIVACCLLPYAVLVSYKDFRSAWTKRDQE